MKLYVNKPLDSRVRENDGLKYTINEGKFQSLDSRLRGNDGNSVRCNLPVMSFSPAT